VAGFAAGAFGAAAFGALGALFFCAIATPGNAISANTNRIRCTIAMLFLGFISLPPDSPRVSRGFCFWSPKSSERLLHALRKSTPQNVINLL
jgi:hypothetical protein